jgi:shikimate kinase
MTYKTKKPLVVLVGPMGAGKTTIGKLLATELGYAFIDSDKEIESRSGADIPWIFDVEGEEGFRNREVSVIQDLSTQANVVLATGGGALTRQENRDHLTRNGFIVYLNTSVDQQYRRTHKDKNRPLLQGDEDARKVLTELMSKRDPIYREVADFIIETDKKSLRVIVKTIVQALMDSDSISAEEV